MLQAPNTVEQYYIGKYSEVTRKHKLNELETPNFVNIKHIRMQLEESSGRIVNRNPKMPPMANEKSNVILVPKWLESIPDKKQATPSATDESITFV